MSKKLEGKVAVVTGASKGIGAEIARQLAAAGAAVVVAGITVLALAADGLLVVAQRLLTPWARRRRA